MLLIYSVLLNCTYSQLSETLFWEYYQKVTAFYKIDTSNTHELTYDSSTRKVSKLFDQSLSQDDAEQTTLSEQPTLCTKSDRINKRYHLDFDGSKNQRMISDIDLNVASGEEDIVNIFIVYKLSSLSGSYLTRCGLFGHDNTNVKKFISFSPQGDLIVSGSLNDHIVIGQNTTNGRSPIAAYKTKANCGEFNKWIGLSVHWNLVNEKSYVYCNGKKLTDVTSKTYLTTGDSKLIFGDINPNKIAALYGSICTFLLYKDHRMIERDIKLHHHVFCKWYNIDHDPITF